MQQDPPHCEDAADAAAVAEQGEGVGEPDTVGCAGGTRGGVRGEQLQEIRGAGDVPEPPGLQEASGAGRGGVRLRQQPRPFGDPLRRVALRGGSPPHLPIRLVGKLVPVPQSRGLPTLLPRRRQDRWPRFVGRLSTVASRFGREDDWVKQKIKNKKDIILIFTK